MYGEGISREGDVLDLAVAQRVIDKSGAWFSTKAIVWDRDARIQSLSLKENPDLLKRIEEK